MRRPRGQDTGEENDRAVFAAVLFDRVRDDTDFRSGVRLSRESALTIAGPDCRLTGPRVTHHRRLQRPRTQYRAQHRHSNYLAAFLAFSFY